MRCRSPASLQPGSWEGSFGPILHLDTRNSLYPSCPTRFLPLLLHFRKFAPTQRRAAQFVLARAT